MRAFFILMLAASSLIAQTATVQGTVTEMGNGHPVRKAEVILRGLTKTGDPPEADNYATETDSNGHFSIEGIVPGKYQAAPARAGFLTRPQGKPMQPGTFAQLTLAAGSHITVDLKLIGTGVISGRTINLNGEAVPGAYVEALQYSYPSRDDSPTGGAVVGLPTDGRKKLETRAGANSNDRGEFRIFGLAPGQYYLRVREMGWQDGTTCSGRGYAISASSISIDGSVLSFAIDGVISDYVGRIFARMNGSLQCATQEQIRGPMPAMAFGTTFYPGTPDFPRATPLDVTAGSELRNTEIRLHPEGVYTISVTKPVITGSDGVPLEVRRRGDAERPNNSITVNGDTMEIHGLLPGSYMVSSSWRDPENPDRAMYAHQAVDVVDHDVDGVVLNFAPMKTITGIVKAEGPLTVPFSGMNVELDPDDTDTDNITTHVSADGTFTVHVRPEAYTLMRPRIATAYIKSVKMGDKELPGPHIDFGRVDGPLTILFGLDAGSVEGTALNADGHPVMPSKITLVPAGDNAGWPGRFKIINADENGKFVIPAVAPGEYKAFAWLDADLGAPLDPEFRKPHESQGVTVKVEANARSLVALRVIVTGR